MASTSAAASASSSRGNAVAARIKSAATSLYSDNQSLLVEFRKAFAMMKEIAVDLERDEHSEKVNELETSVLQLVGSLEDCTHLSSAIQSIGNVYQPGSERTDFKKLFDDEIRKTKASSPFDPQNHSLLRQFREAIWNVHHAGQPMPGEEQEDLIVTSTQFSLLNITCPLSGKPITELTDPVRCMDCKHIYEKKAILHYIKSKNARSQCPVAGCPKILQADRVVCDPLLLVEIDEVRSMSKNATRTDVIEDFTDLDDDEELEIS